MIMMVMVMYLFYNYFRVILRFENYFTFRHIFIYFLFCNTNNPLIFL